MCVVLCVLCVFLCVCFHVVCVCVAWQVVLEDSTRFAEALDGAGVPVTLDVYPRMWHDWVMYSEVCLEATQQTRSSTSVLVFSVLLQTSSSSSSSSFSSSPFSSSSSSSSSFSSSPFSSSSSSSSCSLPL